MIHFCPFFPWLLEYMSNIIEHKELVFVGKALKVEFKTYISLRNYFVISFSLGKVNAEIWG